MIGHGYISTSEFNVEEMEYINDCAAKVNNEELSKDYLMDSVSFNASIASDQDVKAFCDGLYNKLAALSDSEWQETKTQIPFPILYSGSDVPPSN